LGAAVAALCFTAASSKSTLRHKEEVTKYIAQPRLGVVIGS